LIRVGQIKGEVTKIRAEIDQVLEEVRSLPHGNEWARNSCAAVNAYWPMRVGKQLAFAITVRPRCVPDHVCVVADPITDTRPPMRAVALPKRARLLLCGTCKAALEQPRFS